MAATSPGIPPWLRRLYAAPNGLYAARMGWVLGRRFLRLTHVGRRSGRTFHTVLEVARYDRETGEATVVAGYGREADWVRNVLAGGPVEVDVGRGPRPAAYRVLGVDEAMMVYAAYERRYRLVLPVARRMMGYFLGWGFDGSPEATRRMAEQLPMLAFRPARSAVAGSVDGAVTAPSRIGRPGRTAEGGRAHAPGKGLAAGSSARRGRRGGVVAWRREAQSKGPPAT